MCVLDREKGLGTTLEDDGYIIHSLKRSGGDLMAVSENPTLNFNLEAVKVHRE